MWYSEGDIVKSFRDSGCKKAQITVLAELNGCSKERIIQILRKHGVLPGNIQLPRKMYEALVSKKKLLEEELRSVNDSIVMNKRDLARLKAELKETDDLLSRSEIRKGD